MIILLRLPLFPREAQKCKLASRDLMCVCGKTGCAQTQTLGVELNSSLWSDDVEVTDEAAITSNSGSIAHNALE